jgi:hypothetical protein
MQMNFDDGSRRGEPAPPVGFLVGTIIVGILVMVTASLLLRKPPVTDPFDKPADPFDKPAATAPAAPADAPH